MDLIKLMDYGNISHDYKVLLREKKKNSEKERLAALVIQKHFRGFLVRKTNIIYRHLLNNIRNNLEILRCKYLLKKLKREKLGDQRNMYLSDNATKIQKIFRGFYSRKYIHNYFKWKENIIEIDKYVKGQKNKMLYEIEEKRIKQSVYDKKMKDIKIHNVAKNLHHLISTKAQKGVYNYKIENIIKNQQENIINKVKRDVK
ncbi:conserved Plasmodium protein, unknown function [Plasmodium berghei]|uniref:Calmodulin binding protein n=2 Tax=Plasmodium berghei TaxID=5821 RepID=A0A509AK84_PLABA|nr:conserved Plasmodium protein, unknown function [Plasmodium berghei ANKA]CXI45612.1 conserved Plasmodium protein, unknown function [Plasmodium berghei]SCM22695.1 conserved Plasmodium protein, unknown function [Plasmodium berghei]SCN25601.1 conserved Plasmodium protein, unknown function [Plasmodium berghei]SCO60548.1 conserved Plasmodium protein, unknown function [Plasmodium berghei]SCO62303.1 conserved Plasmodium protein, unknown function [Plasmodium berghei]|eukprot:XP_034421719.1 conserved Plasmodium protein, unknown function [Plasmodium berghei ANKA]